MTSPVMQSKYTDIFCKKFAIENGFYKIFAKVQSNTASTTSTSTRRTLLRKHLQKLFFGGDEKDFLPIN
ncbi:hypothetical protein [Archaeoglobus profundus]|uniref:hypothetical protein n=1 Tax=Archaeoglobus profundus TaxID=84156 RepID=UPI0011D0C357|nr:hypothetical protein [Archaeoglobus profundus]